MIIHIPHDWKEPIAVDYVNYSGERSLRVVRPLRVFWGANKWHKEPQWLLDAYDIHKEAKRTFALKDCDFRLDNVPEQQMTSAPVDGSSFEAFDPVFGWVECHWYVHPSVQGWVSKEIDCNDYNFNPICWRKPA